MSIRFQRFSQFFKNISEYKEGIQYFDKEQFKLSDQLFKRCQLILDQQKQQKSQDYIDILRKLAIIQLKLNNKQYPLYAQQIIDISQQIGNQIINQQYNENLIIYYINHDLDKSLSIIDKVQNHKFYLATIQLLSNQNQLSSQNYQHFIQESQNQLLIGYAYNNLAINQEQYIQQDNSLLYKQSLQYIEQKNLDELFDNQKQIEIQQKQSGIVIQNLCNNNLQQMNKQSTFWLNYALKYYEQHNEKQLYKILIQIAQYAIQQKQYMKAEGLLRTSFEIIQDDQYYEIIANKIYSQMLQQIQSRHQEGIQMQEKTQTLELQYQKNKIFNHLLINDIIE